MILSNMPKGSTN